MTASAPATYQKEDQQHQRPVSNAQPLYADVAIHSRRWSCAGMYWQGDARHDEQKAFHSDGQNTRLTSRVSHAGTGIAIHNPAGLQPTGGVL